MQTRVRNGEALAICWRNSHRRNGRERGLRRQSVRVQILATVLFQHGNNNNNNNNHHQYYYYK
jgi:hypothetical protein